MRKLQQLLKFLVVLAGEIIVRTIVTVFLSLLLCELAHTQTPRYSASRNSLQMNRDVVQVEVDTVEAIEDIDTTNLKLNTAEFVESKEDFEEDDKVERVVPVKESIPETITVPQDNLRKVEIVPAPVKVVDTKPIKLEDPNWENKVKPNPPTKVKMDAFDLGMNVDRSEENKEFEKVQLSELTEKGITFSYDLFDSVAISKVPKVRQKEFNDKLFPLCKALEKKHNISAILLMLQLQIESGYGTSCLSQDYRKAFKDKRPGYSKLIRQGANNMLGIHCHEKGIHAPEHCVSGIDSRKRVYFVRYESIEDCLEGYVKFVKKNNYMSLAHKIAKQNGRPLNDFYSWEQAVVSKGYCENKAYYHKLLMAQFKKYFAKTKK